MADKYDNVMLCAECGGRNAVEETNAIEMGGRSEMCEADTECTVCGHVGFWAYGYFSTNPRRLPE